MALYGYECKKHGTFDVWQGMSEKHTAKCPLCDKQATRLFSPAALRGDLPYVNSKHKFGKTRDEMFKNFEGEGFAQKDMHKYDKHNREENLIHFQGGK